MKKLLLIPLFLFISPIIVKANCSMEETTRLSRMINNINTNYEYEYQNNSFIITFSNITSDFIVSDLVSGEDYISYDELELTNLSSGIRKYKIYSKKCSSISSTKNIVLPYYNKYFDSEDCKGIEDYSYCNKWVANEIPYSIFKEKVDAYKKTIEKEKGNEEKQETKKNAFDVIADFIRDLYVRYYIVFLPIIILSLCAIIYLKNKIDQLI